MRKMSDLSLVLVALIIIGCKAADTVGDYRYFPKEIVFQVEVNEKTKVNGKWMKAFPETLSKDVTNDSIALQHVDQTSDSLFHTDARVPEETPAFSDTTVLQDSTADRVKSEEEEHFFTKEELDFFQLLFQRNTQDIERKIFTLLHLKGIDSTLYRKKQVLERTPEIVVTIVDYKVGEFNLIKNMDSQMIYQVVMKDGNKKVIAKFKKKYIVKAVPSQPLETERLAMINTSFCEDLFEFMLRHFKYKLKDGLSS